METIQMQELTPFVTLTLNQVMVALDICHSMSLPIYRRRIKARVMTD